MKAFIPHKDTLLLIEKTQRSFINEYNKNLQPKDFIFPKYPLWAFTETTFNKIDSIKIFLPTFNKEKNTFYFPLLIESENTKTELKIEFANTQKTQTIDMNAIPKVYENIQNFPLNIRVFKTGDVLLQDNGWQLFAERWNKITC